MSAENELARLDATAQAELVRNGDVAPIAEFADVCQRHGAYLYVDEAHSYGVFGDGGRGIAEEQGVLDKIDFYSGTFSKSLASVGGFCASRHPTRAQRSGDGERACKPSAKRSRQRQARAQRQVARGVLVGAHSRSRVVRLVQRARARACDKKCTVDNEFSMIFSDLKKNNEQHNVVTKILTMATVQPD